MDPWLGSGIEPTLEESKRFEAEWTSDQSRYFRFDFGSLLTTGWLVALAYYDQFRTLCDASSVGFGRRTLPGIFDTLAIIQSLLRRRLFDVYWQTGHDSNSCELNGAKELDCELRWQSYRRCRPVRERHQKRQPLVWNENIILFRIDDFRNF